MSTAKQVRVLLLLILLLPLVILAFWEQDRRPDWQRTLIVGLYPHNADGSAEVDDWIERLVPEDFQPIEDFLAEQATRHGLELEQPFEIRLGEVISHAPPPPPAGGAWYERLSWAVRLRWWHFRLDRQGLEPDIVLVASYQKDPTGFTELHSIGMPSPRLGLSQLSGGEEHTAFNQVVLAHELLHTVGALDLYGPDGRAQFPEGYAEPDREPRYPQQRAELMAMALPLSPELSHPPRDLGEVQVGQRTAEEIGW